MAEIHTTTGERITISDEDLAWAEKFRWYRTSGEGRYVATRIDGRTTYMHRALTNAPKGMDVDHINGDSRDNRRENLRVCTHTQNMRAGRPPKRANSKSKYSGVGWNESANQWVARIRINGKLTYLGCFKDETAAARAYDKAALEYFGEFARLNFPTEAQL